MNVQYKLCLPACENGIQRQNAIFENGNQMKRTITIFIEILGYKKTARMIPLFKETAKKKHPLMKPVIKEYDNKRNHQLRNMTKRETVNLGYRILETSNFQIKEKMKTSIMKQTLFSDSLQNEMLMIHTILVQNNNLYWYKSDAWTNLQRYRLT